MMITIIEMGSPSNNCSHEALPFVEAASETEITSSIEAQTRQCLAAPSARGIADVPILTA
jgi:hypothetical protein